MTLSTRHLADDDFAALHRAWLEAFGDYAVRFDLSDDQLRELLRRRGYAPEVSVGVFEGTRLVAFTLTGVGTWRGAPAAYDTGTAVIPELRRHGLGGAMLDQVVPALRSRAIETYVLEVIESNAAAVALYTQHGFVVSRRLRCFTRALDARAPSSAACELRAHEGLPDWNVVAAFWDWTPSWQSSIESLARSRAPRTTIAAYAGPDCVGYAIVFPETQDLAQLAVARHARGRGVGARLLAAAGEAIPANTQLRILNVDGSATGTLSFLEKCGARPLLDQLEMTLAL